MADETPHSLPSSRQLITSIISELANYHPTPTTAIGVVPTPSKNASATTTGTLQPAQNRLSKLSEEELSRVKPLLLTLHCLFPNEFLLALDILDRRLVRKLAVSANGDQNKVDEIYFVRSISSSSNPASRWRRRQWQKQNQEHLGGSAAGSDRHFYEVRLRAWNCSCPAFTLASLRGISGGGNHQASGLGGAGGDCRLAYGEWMFGDGDGGCTSDGRRRIIQHLRGLSGDENWKEGEEGNDPVVVCKHLLACVLGTKCPGLFDGGIEEVVVNMKEAAGWCAG